MRLWSLDPPLVASVNRIAYPAAIKQAIISGNTMFTFLQHRITQFTVASNGYFELI